MVLETVKPGLHLGGNKDPWTQGPHWQEASGGRQRGPRSTPRVRPTEGKRVQAPVRAHTCGRVPRAWLSAPGPRGSHLHPTTCTQALQFWAQPGWTGPDAGLGP